MWNLINIDDVPELHTVTELAEHVLLQTGIPERFKGQQFKDVQKLSCAQDIDGADTSDDDH